MKIQKRRSIAIFTSSHISDADQPKYVKEATTKIVGVASLTSLLALKNIQNLVQWQWEFQNNLMNNKIL